MATITHSDLEASIQQCLRSSEDLRAVLRTTAVPAPSRAAVTAQRASTSSGTSGEGGGEGVWGSPALTRIVAVVANGETSGEQASVIIFKPNPSKRTYTTHAIFPICGEFSISMAQSAPPPSHSYHETRPTSNTTALSITLKAGSDTEPLTLLTHDVHRLKVLLGECKKLKEVSEAPSKFIAFQTYSWLAPYTAKDKYPITSTHPHPPSLLTALQPLHTRLSPASAGLPSDDAADVAIIKEEWIVGEGRKGGKVGSRRLRYVLVIYL